MSKQGPRRTTARSLSPQWRGVARARDRERAKEIAARTEADRFDAELVAQLNRESMRFGVTVPADPFLLDVLARIDVENPGEVWRWRGNTNNRGVMTVRTGRGERSVPRYLAESFGVVTPEQEGILYPRGDRDDVNPWHREWRMGTGLPVGRRSNKPVKECVECGVDLPQRFDRGRPRTTCSPECAATRQTRAVREHRERRRAAS